MSALLLLFLLVMPLYADLLEVPMPFGTIQQALHAAREGDTVLVHPGRYCERLTAPPLRCTLASRFLLTGDSAFIRQTILEPDASGTQDSLSILYMTQDNSELRLCGFILQSGRGTILPEYSNTNAGAILQRAGRLTVERCVLRDNEAYYYGGAIWSERSLATVLDRCEFHDDSSYGGNVICWFTDSVIVRNTRFHRMRATLGSAVVYHGAQYALMDSCLLDSSRCDFGSNVVYWDCDSAICRNTVFRHNISDTINVWPGHVLGVQDGLLYVDNCLIDGNVTYSSLVITQTRSGLYLNNCVFRNNISVFGAVAVAVTQQSYADIRNCLFEDNLSRHWSAISNADCVTVRDSHFSRNCAWLASNGAAIPHIPSGLPESVTVANSSFVDNTPRAIYTEDESPDDPLNAAHNWWGDASGPYHETLNPDGRGDVIAGTGIEFVPWLTEPPQDLTDDPHQPRRYVLLNAYPNPFNGAVRLAFEPAVKPRILQIYDLLGRQVADLTIAPGQAAALWQPVALPSGVYFARLESAALRMHYLR